MYSFHISVFICILCIIFIQIYNINTLKGKLLNIENKYLVILKNCINSEKIDESILTDIQKEFLLRTSRLVKDKIMLVENNTKLNNENKKLTDRIEKLKYVEVYIKDIIETSIHKKNNESKNKTDTLTSSDKKIANNIAVPISTVEDYISVCLQKK